MMSDAACMMVRSLLLAPPHFPEGISDVNNWLQILENMIESWTDVRSSNFHFLNISSTLFLSYSISRSPKAPQFASQVVTNLLESKSRLKSPLGYLIVFDILFFLLGQHHMYVNSVEGKKKEEWNLQQRCQDISVAINSLQILKAWWSFAQPILAFGEGLQLLFKGNPKKAVAAWRKGIKIADEISDNLKFLKALLQARIVRYSPGNDAMKMEVADFFQKVGALQELASLMGESFSPMAPIQEEEESPIDQEPVPEDFNP